MAITNKEYNYKGIQGCRCKYCFNKRASKIPSINKSRNYIKRDTEKEYKNSYGLEEQEIINESIYEEDDYIYGYGRFLEEKILDTLTDEQLDKYLVRGNDK